MADVRFSGIRCAFCDLPGAFDALQRHAHLRIASRFGQLFDGVPVAVAAREIHPPVHGDRIALKDLLDQADALEELAPVEGRHEAEAPDQVRHERLFGRLMPRLRTDGVLNRLTARGQCRIELVAQRRGRLMLARPLKQADDERRVELAQLPQPASQYEEHLGVIRPRARLPPQAVDIEPVQARPGPPCEQCQRPCREDESKGDSSFHRSESEGVRKLKTALSSLWGRRGKLSSPRLQIIFPADSSVLGRSLPF